jgi:hypothetical protein
MLIPRVGRWYLTNKGFLRLTGALKDDDLDLAYAPHNCDQLTPRRLTLGTKTLEIPVDQYTFDQAKTHLFGGKVGRCYIGVGSTENARGESIDFVLGFNTLKTIHGCSR